MALDDQEKDEVKRIAHDEVYEAIGNLDDARAELRKRGIEGDIIKAMHQHIRQLEDRIKKLEKGSRFT